MSQYSFASVKAMSPEPDTPPPPMAAVVTTTNNPALTTAADAFNPAAVCSGNDLPERELRGNGSGGYYRTEAVEETETEIDEAGLDQVFLASSTRS